MSPPHSSNAISLSSNEISLTVESRFSSFGVSASSLSFSVEIFISVRDRIKVKITLCTIERNIFCRHKFKCAKALNYSKDVVFLTKVFRKTSIKPLKSIVNRINYSAFDSGFDALLHALFEKIDKFDNNRLF